MCPDFRLNKQAGAGLPIALFIITVLSLIVLGMSQLQESSGQSISLQIQSQRAFYAAESGAQVAVRNALVNNTCATGPTTLSFDTPGLSTCRAFVTCNSIPDTELSTGETTVYSIESSGQCGVGADQATRVIEVRVR